MGKRIYELDEVSAYDADLSFAVDKTGNTAALQMPLSSFLPEFLKVDIGGWDMYATHYHTVALGFDTDQIVWMGLTIYDDNGRAYSGEHLYDNKFHDLFGSTGYDWIHEVFPVVFRTDKANQRIQFKHYYGNVPDGMSNRGGMYETTEDDTWGSATAENPAVPPSCLSYFLSTSVSRGKLLIIRDRTL
jgi:hypothetical protein